MGVFFSTRFVETPVFQRKKFSVRMLVTPYEESAYNVQLTLLTMDTPKAGNP